MDFNPKQHLAITKAILELIDPEGDITTEHNARRGSRLGDTSLTFIESDTDAYRAAIIGDYTYLPASKM